jgi:hypothetical protein
MLGTSKIPNKTGQFNLGETPGEGLPGEIPNFSGDSTGYRETRRIEYGISSIGPLGKITNFIGDITDINIRKQSFYSLLPFQYPE